MRDVAFLSLKMTYVDLLTQILISKALVHNKLLHYITVKFPTRTHYRTFEALIVTNWSNEAE